MVNGRRVTDQKSIDVTAMVLNGLINTRILAICRELDIEAIGLSGVDAGLIRAHKRGPVPVSAGSSDTVDYGFVGDIDSVNAAVIEKLLAERPDAGGEPAVGGLERHAAQHQRRHGGGRDSAAPCRRRSWCCAPARREFSSASHDHELGHLLHRHQRA